MTTTSTSGASNSVNHGQRNGIIRTFSNAFKRSRASTYVLNVDTLPKERKIGIFNYRPNYLQTLNDPKWLLLVLTVFQLSVGMTIVGFRTSMVTSIEKRFKLTSLHFGIIVAFYNVGGAITGAILVLLGRRWSRSITIGSGCFVVGISYILFALPHFLIGSYNLTISQQGSTLTCNSSLYEYTPSTPVVIPCRDSIYRYWVYISFFIISQFLAGCGASTLWTMAWDYIEENVSPTASSVYTTSIMLTSGFGPSIGFILGAFLVNTYVDWPNKPQEVIDVDNPEWIGAWWLGFLAVGLCLVIISSIIILFPPFLAKYDYYKSRLSNINIHSSGHAGTFNYLNYSITGVSTMEGVRHDGNFAYRSGADNITDYTHFTMLIKQFLKNKALIYLVLGLTIQGIGLSGFAIFLTKYFQIIYSINPFLASFISLLTIVVGFGGGTFLGNIVTSANRISIATISRFVTISSIIGIAACMSFLFACSTVQIAGINIDYHGNLSQHSAMLTSSCNMDCRCQSQAFKPICDLNTNITYFSPCHGGCKMAKNLELDHKDVICKCSNSTKPNRVKFGPCQRGCALFVPFLLGLITLIFSTTLCIIPSSQALIRCVPQKQRFAVLSINWFIIRLFGAGSGSIAAGLILDSSCLIWHTECENSGHCLEYDTRKLSIIMTIYTCILKIASTIFLYLGWKSYGILMFEQDPTNLTYHSFIRRYYSWHFCRLKGDHLKVRLNSTLRPRNEIVGGLLYKSKGTDSNLRTSQRERMPLQSLQENSLSNDTNTVVKTISNETCNRMRVSYESNV